MSYRTLVNLTLVLTYLLIVVGAATRVWDAGLSCPDWPHCYGHWWPWPESRIIADNGLGYVVGNTHYQWWQVFLEWSHRSLAAVIGVLVLGLVAGAKLTRQPNALWAPLAAMAALLAVQISLGGLTVLKGNIHWSVAAHLGTAMLFFASLVWLRRRAAIHAAGVVSAPLTLSRPVILAFGLFALLVWSTMMVGAMVSSSHAGGVCGGLFSCGGEWLPADWSQLWHMNHRYLALAVFGLSVLLMILAKRVPDHSATLRAIAKHLHLMVLGQVALGIATLYSFSHYPAGYEVLSLAHLAWGTLVFMAAVGALLTLRYGTAGRFHG